MDIKKYQAWISEFYKERNWYQYPPFIRANFLTEEVGEVAREFGPLKLGGIVPMKDRPLIKNSWTI